jgi:putative thioredoxin
MTPDALPLIYDVDRETFNERVLQASLERAVVVDFWAAWCQPCRALGPVLEEVVTAAGGRAALARVNVDQEPELAAQYGVRGIPAVKVFRDAGVVTEFVGALPQGQVERILGAVIPKASDEAAAQALEALQAGRTDEAEKGYRAVLESEPRHAGALLGLALIALQKGDETQAAELARQVDPGTPEHEQAAAVLAQVAFREACRQSGGRGAADRRVKADPKDLDARYDLAVCLAAHEDYAAALDEFLRILQADKRFRDGAAKDAMVRIFSIVGQRSDVADAYRSRLAQVLY